MARQQADDDGTSSGHGERARTRGRCLIFNPYFAVLGGGERYTVALGEALSDAYDVTYASSLPPAPYLAGLLGFPPIDVTHVELSQLPHVSLAYDLVVAITLYLPPPSFAARSVLVVQFPLEELPPRRWRRWLTVLKLRRYRCVVYSDFVRRELFRRWRVRADVLMPGVELAEHPRAEKENLILSVGRFVARDVDAWNKKRQDVLIEAFAQLPPAIRESWRLVLAGGAAPSPDLDAFVDTLKERAAGLNISFELNVPPERLNELLDRARLFWHATGYERPPSAPESAEHFGMSTVEAMSHGSVPLVYADGGQVEIVSADVGRLWRSIPELVDQTTELVNGPAAELDALSRAARDASEGFGQARFAQEARRLLRASSPQPIGVARRFVRVMDRTRRRVLHRLYVQRERRNARGTPAAL